ncbi:hypothetical protein CR513_18233, partial [Mucuna pruriens]
MGKSSIENLKNGSLPEHKSKAIEVRKRASQYLIEVETLYKREFSMSLLKDYIECRAFGNVNHLSAKELQNIMSSWPFTIWEMDILGPFLVAKGQTQFDFVEEYKEQTCIRQEACKQRVTKRYNSKVKPRDFIENNLVWRKIGEVRKQREEGKLAANWEGPFRIREALNNGAYQLENVDGTNIPRT